MKKIIEPLMVIGLCILAPGCASRAGRGNGALATNAPAPVGAFIQGDTVIVPPLRHARIQPGLDDGGTIRATLTDARGKALVIYIDHRARSVTRGDVYLFAYPAEKGSVRVLNQQEFRDKLGDFDKGPSSSF
jgi:hypothetical protein